MPVCTTSCGRRGRASSETMHEPNAEHRKRPNMPEHKNDKQKEPARALANFVKPGVIMSARTYQSLLVRCVQEQRAMSELIERAVEDYLDKPRSEEERHY